MASRRLPERRCWETTRIVAPPVETEATVATSFTPAPGVDPAQAEDWARRFGALVSSGDVAAAAALFSPEWTKVGTDDRGRLGHRAARRRDRQFRRVGGVDRWARVSLGVDRARCRGLRSVQRGTESGTGALRRRLSGPYPEAMGLDPFELPLTFTAGEDGLTEFGTDFAAAESGRLIPDAATERYLATLPGFVLHTSSDRDFTAECTLGSGRPVVTQESAAAHLAKAEEWIAAGMP